MSYLSTLFVLVAIAAGCTGYAHAQTDETLSFWEVVQSLPWDIKEDPVETGVLDDGTLVSVWISYPHESESIGIEIDFVNSEHVNYDIIVTQNDREILRDENRYESDGKGTHHTERVIYETPIDITIIFRGYGSGDSKSGPLGNEVVFTDVVPIKQAKMDRAPDATGMLSDGTLISVWSTEPTAGQAAEIAIEFVDADYPNYEVIVTQNDQEVLRDAYTHIHEGKGIHKEKTSYLSTDDPIDITIIFHGHGFAHNITGPVSEKVVFANIVPEFGSVAMAILAVAIVSIIAVTARNRTISQF